MDPTNQATIRDPQGSHHWDGDDTLTRLRLWATEYAHPLPEPCVPLKLGSGPGCDVRLRDSAGRLSREHAMLVPVSGGWEIHDLGSTNGVRVDAFSEAPIALRAGARIRLGGLSLVAESRKFMRLRSLVCRLLGWAPGRQAAVDEALQSLRDGATQRTPVVLVGDGDLVPVASRLQRMTLGPDAPFLAYDGGEVSAAIQDARHGTLCVPTRFRAAASMVADAVRGMEAALRPRLVLCARTDGQVAGLGAWPERTAVIALPPLSTRRDEMMRLIHEAAQDVVADVGAPSTGFTTHDLDRLQEIEFSGMADFEQALRRIIAMRCWGVKRGAEKLGFRHSSLSEWTRNKDRKLST